MLPDWQWQLLSLPPRYFSWRVRGNPLYWSEAERETLEAGYDLVVATSMVDLATLRGLVPALANTPCIYYFHENQFAYPANAAQPDTQLLEAQMVSLYGALSADRVVFNTRYNRDTFFAGLDALLGRLPDHVPPQIVPGLQDKSRVLPVPVQCPVSEGAGDAGFSPRGADSFSVPRLVWVGRFEYDKGAATLLELLRALRGRGLAFEIAVIGQQFRNSPPEFAQIATEFGRELAQFGYLQSTREYRAWLHAADMVVSTALHEFQGVAVLEAVAAACIPVVPDRLAYAELYPDRYRYPSFPGDASREGSAGAELVEQLFLALQAGEVHPPDISAFAPGALADDYRALCALVAG